MKEININELKNDLISKTIMDIVNNFSKSKDIDGIYITTFNEQYSLSNQAKKINKKITKPTIEIVLITKNKINNENIDKLLQKVSQKANIDLILTTIPFNNFDIKMDTLSKEIACRDLVNGKIVLDRNGYYTKLKDQLLLENGVANIPYSNKVTIPLKVKTKNIV